MDVDVSTSKTTCDGRYDSFCVRMCGLRAIRNSAPRRSNRRPTSQHVHPRASVRVSRSVSQSANPAAKKSYFESYANLDEPPEQWVSISLGNFHWPGQSPLTRPYLRPALEKVEWVKKNRKVFFMPAWVGAFVNGHSSQEALDVVNEFLAEYSDLPTDIRRKILQSLDSLQRAVRIKKRWN